MAKLFYVVNFSGYRYASETLEEAFDLAGLTVDSTYGTHTGYWSTVEVEDAGEARLVSIPGKWIEFYCIPH